MTMPDFPLPANRTAITILLLAALAITPYFAHAEKVPLHETAVQLEAELSPAQQKIKDDTVAFFRAVKVDNHGAVSELLQQGVDPNQIQDERGEFALMMAVREESPRVLKVLLAAKQIKLNQTAKNGDTAIMVAAFKGNLEAVKALLAAGAEINRPGWTALHYAALAGHTEIVRALLEHSAYIDAEAPNKSTPIMLAAYGGHIYTVKLLLDEGADMTLKNDLGMTAIDFAAKGNHQMIVEGLSSRLKKMQPKTEAAAK